MCKNVAKVPSVDRFYETQLDCFIFPLLISNHNVSSHPGKKMPIFCPLTIIWVSLFQIYTK